MNYKIVAKYLKKHSIRHIKARKVFLIMSKDIFKLQVQNRYKEQYIYDNIIEIFTTLALEPKKSI